ncbi:hypothetical protein ACO1PK_00705 [Alishewanella sp. d11]|uniref:hypothetical protein n=1 Tax=Alishewanella sp. d11 TaxID=3414030 RepID=UPI003BF7CB18
MAITTNVPSDRFEDLQRDVQDISKFANSEEVFFNRVGLPVKPISIVKELLSSEFESQINELNGKTNELEEALISTTTSNENIHQKLESWSQLSEFVWETNRPSGWVHSLHLAGVAPNSYNRVSGVVNFIRFGDYTVSETKIQVKWPVNPALSSAFVTIGPNSSNVDAGKRILQSQKIVGENVWGGIHGFEIRAASTLINCQSNAPKFNGFDINAPTKGTRLIKCVSEMCGQTDNGETSLNVGHGIIVRSDCVIIGHVSRKVAEDGYQIGTAIGSGIPEDHAVELINCEAYSCYEDFLDIKETGQKLTIRGFKGWGAADSAVNYHPTIGTGLCEITDSRFGGAVQMLRVNQQGVVPSKIISARNIYDQSNKHMISPATMPALDWNVSNVHSESFLVSMADVFIGGGNRSGVVKAVVNIQGRGDFKFFNDTIHVPSTGGHEQVSAIVINNVNAVVRSYNCCITKYAGVGQAYLIDITSDQTDVLIRDGLLWIDGAVGTTPFVKIAGVEYTQNDLTGSSYGGANNLIVGNVRIERMLTTSPNYIDEPSNNLAPAWETVHMNIHGRRQWAPQKDVLGAPYAYFSWMGGSPSESITVGAYNSLTARFIVNKTNGLLDI